MINQNTTKKFQDLFAQMNIKIVKYSKLLIILFCLLSCKNSIDNSNGHINRIVLGNWNSVKDGSYQEYFFNKTDMSIYSQSGNIYTYSYLINSDGVLKIKEHSGTEAKSYKFFDEIISIDSTKIMFENRTLLKIGDENSLEQYFNKTIDYDTLNFYSQRRKEFAIPLDTLMKLSGEPVNLDDL